MKQLLMASVISIGLALPQSAMAALNIVATTPALAHIAQAVCGEDGQVRSLAKLGQDPHFVAPKPTLARYLAEADILFSVGLALESGWLPPLLSLSRNPNIQVGAQGYIAGSDYIDVIGGGGKVDRSLGDVHPEGNPHWWLDPVRVAKVVHALATKFAQMDAAHAGAYIQRAKDFDAKIQDLVKRWQAQLKVSPKVVTYHDSYRYLVDRFGIQVIGFIEPKPGVEASTRHLDDLITRMKSQSVSQIWTEPYHQGRIVRQVASLAGAQVLNMPDAVKGDGSQAYLGLITSILQQSLAAKP